MAQPGWFTRARGQTTRLVSTGFVMRLVVDTAVRMLYPYLPEISRGLGISLAQGGLLVSLRSAMIFPSPLFGVWSDRHGPRLLLATALLVQGVSLWWFSTAHGLLAAIPPALLMGLASAAFIPVLQAAISERVPFQRRGRILAMVEFSWAITGLVILPLVGLLMVARGWQAPFRVVAVISLVIAPLPLLLFPRRHQEIGRPRTSLRQMARVVGQNRSALAVIIVNGLMFLAAEGFFVTYGAWLERSFRLAPDEIGRVAALLGLAELTGSGLSSLFIDRVGKRRGVGVGLLAMTVTMMLLPMLGVTLVLTVAGMVIFATSFEFTIVSNIGLMSEQVPQARGTVLALGSMAAGAVRAVTGFGSVVLFEWRGMQAVAVVSALGTIIGLLVLWRWAKERGEE